ncbi:MAG: hypothetical protein QXT68_08135 [Halobacteria archaeon]
MLTDEQRVGEQGEHGAMDRRRAQDIAGHMNCFGSACGLLAANCWYDESSTGNTIADPAAPQWPVETVFHVLAALAEEGAQKEFSCGFCSEEFVVVFLQLAEQSQDLSL